MMLGMRGLVLASILFLSVLQAPFDPEPGISESLARDRAARISNLRYDLSFVIPADRREVVESDRGQGGGPRLSALNGGIPW